MDSVVGERTAAGFGLRGVGAWSRDQALHCGQVSPRCGLVS